MLPEGVARHWKMKLFSVFLLNLMSFPILQVRLHFCMTKVVFLSETPKDLAKKFKEIPKKGNRQRKRRKAWRVNTLSMPCVFVILQVVLSSSLGFSDYCLESFGVVDSEVSQYLTVDFDACFVEGTHQLRVRQAFETGSSVDTLNPQGAEVALLVLTVAISISQTLFPGILGYGPNVLSCTKVTSGQTQNFLSSCS